MERIAIAMQDGGAGAGARDKAAARAARPTSFCLAAEPLHGPPGRGTFWFQIFIQAPSPEIWSETISGGEEVLAGKWGGLFLGYLLGRNYRRRDRDRLVPPRRTDAAVCRAEVCYPFCRKHGRHRAVRRREFIALFGGAAAWPLAARAQDAGKVARIGFLGPAQTSPPAISFYQAFLTQMRELGFRDGENLRIDFRAIEDPRGLSVGAEELMRSQPELIVATGPEVSLRAVVAASGAIPVVMIAINFDPIARGYVTSLARPGGNITGVVFQQLELAHVAAIKRGRKLDDFLIDKSAGKGRRKRRSKR